MVLAGNVVQPGQPIFSIYDQQNIWITANLEETKLAHIKIGDPVKSRLILSWEKVPGQGHSAWPPNTASQFALIPPSNASGNFTKVTPARAGENTIENKDNFAPARNGR